MKHKIEIELTQVGWLDDEDELEYLAQGIANYLRNYAPFTYLMEVDGSHYTHG